jgi:cellulose biosynthesis protein BcsQ
MSSYRIAVAARKGGVGKTTIACGIASVLASKKLRVLVIDLDPQSNAAFILGGDPTQPGTATLLSGQSPRPLAIDDYLAVLPGGPELMNHAIQQLRERNKLVCFRSICSILSIRSFFIEKITLKSLIFRYSFSIILTPKKVYYKAH